MSVRSQLARAIVMVMRGMVTTLLWPLGTRHRQRLISDLSAALGPVREVALDGGKRIRFACPTYDAVYRAETFFTKEPDTLRWIDSFASGDVLWDVGANVGVYALYAAIKSGLTVVCFEPSASNYWLLNKNIELNGVDDRVKAYCVALSRSTGVGTFNMGDTRPGGALYQFGEEVEQFQYPGVGRQTVVFHQAMIGFSIDEFLSRFDVPAPSHLKIDIDGLEEDVLLGATHLLSSNGLRSILVELEADDAAAVERVKTLLARCGFEPPLRVSAGGDEAAIFNFIFSRVRHVEHAES